jgi:DNA-binding response OmpR family regulator
MSTPACVVVDDELAIVEVVCDVLGEAGIAAVGTTESRGAFHYIRETQPRMVILDVQMPGQTGIDLFHQLRQDPNTQNMPVIFLTANRHLLDHLLPNYPQVGATLLPKPFSMANLVTLVRDVLAAAKAG